jgi:hypothetical protein
MLEIITALTESSKIPKVGKYYVFVYNPKSPNIQYDQNPLVAVTDVFSWGFRGINFHWQQVRQYTWEEVAGNMHVVNEEEIKDFKPQCELLHKNFEVISTLNTYYIDRGHF